MGIALMAEFVGAIVDLLQSGVGEREGAWVVGLAIGFTALLQLAIIFAAWRTYLGHSRARTILMTLAALSIPVSSTVRGDLYGTLASLGLMACYVFALVALSSPSSRRWVRAMTWLRRGERGDADVSETRAPVGS